jgi:hypothetical protein
MSGKDPPGRKWRKIIQKARWKVAAEHTRKSEAPEKEQI